MQQGMTARFEDRNGDRYVIVSVGDGREIAARSMTELAGLCYRATPRIDGRAAAAAWSAALRPTA